MDHVIKITRYGNFYVPLVVFLPFAVYAFCCGKGLKYVVFGCMQSQGQVNFAFFNFFTFSVFTVLL